MMKLVDFMLLLLIKIFTVAHHMSELISQPSARERVFPLVSYCYLKLVLVFC